MNKKKKLILVAGILSLLLVIVINQPVVYIVYAVFIVLCALNLKVFNKNRFWAKNINNLHIIGRNYNVLLIGEPMADAFSAIANNAEDTRTIQITSNGRSLEASTILAYRLFSLLRPGGKLIITYKNKKGVSTLDIPYIHDVTLKEIGKSRKLQYFPLFINPLRSLDVLFGLKHGAWTKVDNEKDLSIFCSERNIELDTYKV